MKETPTDKDMNDGRREGRLRIGTYRTFTRVVESSCFTLLRWSKLFELSDYNIPILARMSHFLDCK